MELKKHFDWRKAFWAFYAGLFLIYIVVGLQPVRVVDYEIIGTIKIPSINLISDVTGLQLEEHRLNTPDSIVGSFSKAKNKTLLIGHSTTVFQDLEEIKLKDTIEYNAKTYRVYKIETKAKQNINMSDLLETSSNDTVVLMTCAGELLGNGDATHRLIITAVED